MIPFRPRKVSRYVRLQLIMGPRASDFSQWKSLPRWWLFSSLA
jgi:hypothetical protein